MKNKRLERLLDAARRRITPRGLLRLYGALGGLLFTYTLLYLLTTEEFGAYSALTEQIGTLLEHGLIVFLLGLGGFLLVDLLKREEQQTKE